MHRAKAEELEAAKEATKALVTKLKRLDAQQTGLISTANGLVCPQAWYCESPVPMTERRKSRNACVSLLKY